MGRLLDDSIIPEAEVMETQFPFPAVAIHKPFGSSVAKRVPMERLHVLDRLVNGPCLVALRAALQGRQAAQRLSLAEKASIGDIAGKVTRLVRESPPSGSNQTAALELVHRACDVLREANDATIRQRLASSSMVLRDESSSFGRFFTLPATLRKVAERLVPLIDPIRDTFVDFSCGTNEFGFMLGLK